ncbi:FeS assembly protein SufD [Rubidibacter lacunae KORDI 51-2]|uniref:FeS assembly protein SufD n=1 Tax=Rubidibacter lacunae KORDI 51-2 TaxID=582515 RepID=U5DDU7_9CHRO|nr:Fe-S cluster assembly protein SufD [Rubidibacter lacunae]ERN42683.1 FeS assembly protein SufD [Rubidibacter lacunae KORDI 51-2]
MSVRTSNAIASENRSVSGTAIETSGDLTPLLQQCRSELVAPTDEVDTWLRQWRGEACARLTAARMPTRQDEEWRFTDLSPLFELDVQQSAELVDVVAKDIEAMTLPDTAGSRLVFVNGFFAAHLSDTSALPDGVFAGNLAQLGAEKAARLPDYLGRQEGRQEVFTALNEAGIADLAVVWVEPNVVVEHPIQLLFLAAPGERSLLIQPRSLVVAGRSSSVQIVEQFATLADNANSSYWTNSVSEFWLDANAQIAHTRCQLESASAAIHIGRTAVGQARDSRYTCNALDVGARLSRHNLDVYVEGEQADTRLNGLSLADDNRLTDTHSAIYLRAPHCTSNQLHKCIAGDRAHAVFNGKVFVPKIAQLTDAAQLNRNLMLSPKARIDTKPQLQIVADNVKCSHGATVGQLEPDEIFYLRSRGLDEAAARNLLVAAFAAEVIDRIPIARLRDRLAAHVASAFLT